MKKILTLVLITLSLLVTSQNVLVYEKVIAQEMVAKADMTSDWEEMWTKEQKGFIYAECGKYGKQFKFHVGTETFNFTTKGEWSEAKPVSDMEGYNYTYIRAIDDNNDQYYIRYIRRNSDDGITFVTVMENPMVPGTGNLTFLVTSTQKI